MRHFLFVMKSTHGAHNSIRFLLRIGGNHDFYALCFAQNPGIKCSRFLTKQNHVDAIRSRAFYGGPPINKVTLDRKNYHFLAVPVQPEQPKNNSEIVIHGQVSEARGSF